MRTNIDIDGELLARAMASGKYATKRAAVNEGLRLLAEIEEQTRALAELNGVGWVGDLEKMRLDKPARRA